MNTIIINGNTYQGNSIKAINGVVYIDGVKQVDIENRETVLEIHGSVGSVESDQSITVIGKVSGDATAGGSINCDDVGGDVTCKGSVNCDDVRGSVRANGSVCCDDIHNE